MRLNANPSTPKGMMPNGKLPSNQITKVLRNLLYTIQFYIIPYQIGFWNSFRGNHHTLSTWPFQKLQPFSYGVNRNYLECMKFDIFIPEGDVLARNEGVDTELVSSLPIILAIYVIVKCWWIAWTMDKMSKFLIFIAQNLRTWHSSRTAHHTFVSIGWFSSSGAMITHLWCGEPFGNSTIRTKFNLILFHPGNFPVD